MGSLDRQKKRDMLWKKAIVHFSLCFAMGFFTGFAPSSTGTDSIFTSAGKVASPVVLSSSRPGSAVAGERVFNRSLMSQTASEQRHPEKDGSDGAQQQHVALPPPRRLVILVTTARPGGADPFRAASLSRLANTLRLVPPPLVWMVVEPHAGAADTAGMLRMTGIMYRHLVYRENFTDDPAAEVEHQRNLALNHLEHHRLDGVVHLGDMNNAYHLDFFEHIRAIEAFGTWPVAFLSPNRKRVVIEGPICRDSQILGWHVNFINTNATATRRNSSVTVTHRIPNLRVSSFAFNSSILWDPERWGRSSSISDTSQDSFKFIQQTVVEDNTKLLPVPPDCNRIMVWRLHMPSPLFPAYIHSSDPQRNQT